MSSEISESLLQLRNLCKDLLDAFAKLLSLLEKFQEARDVISDLPDAQTLLKEQGYTGISMPDIFSADFEIFNHKRELGDILQVASAFIKIIHQNYPDLITDAE
jgi:hypothetical protein